MGAWIDEFEGRYQMYFPCGKCREQHENILRFAKGRCPVNHPVVMFRKSAVLKAGGYKHFPLFEDYYLWVRMLMNGARFYNIQESLLFFRFSPDMFRRRGRMAVCRNGSEVADAVLQDGFYRLFLLAKECLYSLSDPSSP